MTISRGDLDRAPVEAEAEDIFLLDLEALELFLDEAEPEIAASESLNISIISTDACEGGVPMVAVVAACAVLVMVPPDVDELLLVEGSFEESGANVSRERSNPAAIAASSLSMSRATAS